tara:strand:+ start:293 stop:877 length:585 start_codon:yes stop_codon:yes gene_type:complete
VVVVTDRADDAALVVRARAELAGGSHAAFGELYRRHSGEVFRFVRKLSGDDALADDVVQDTFLRVLRSLERFDERRAFRPWLARIARNAAFDALRERQKLTGGRELSESAEPETGSRIGERVAGLEAAALARAALDDLPDEQRALLLQRHQLGLTQVELAESWQVSERTIRNRLNAAVKALTQALLARRVGGAL